MYYNKLTYRSPSLLGKSRSDLLFLPPWFSLKSLSSLYLTQFILLSFLLIPPVIPLILLRRPLLLPFWVKLEVFMSLQVSRAPPSYRGTDWAALSLSWERLFPQQTPCHPRVFPIPSPRTPQSGTSPNQSNKSWYLLISIHKENWWAKSNLSYFISISREKLCRQSLSIHRALVSTWIDEFECFKFH